MDKTLETYASYAASLSYNDLTPAAILAVKRSVVDSIGCAFGAFNAGPIKSIRKLAAEVGSTQPATVIGTTIKSSAEWAGFANGCAIRYLDFSDDYFGGTGAESGPHPSDNIGSVLAAAESAGVDGKMAVLGVALAYEGCDQLVDKTVMRPHGWDYPIMHSVGTALGAGKMLGLTKEQFGNAVALAVVPNVCLRETRLGGLANWKGLAGPNGSRNGLFAALLAKEGITGPPEAFEGKAGFMKQLSSPFTLGKMGGKGTPFKIEGTYFKSIQVMYSIQLPVWTALQLRKKVKWQDIKSLKVFLDEHGYVGGGYSPERWDPKTRETADHSGPYLIAAALVDGEITEKTYEEKRFRDPVILEFMKKISATDDPQYTKEFPKDFNCRMEATLNSGEVVKVHEKNVKGHPKNPMSEKELEEKFLKQVGDLLPAKQSRAILDSLWDIEKTTDLSMLMAGMVVKGKQ